MTTPAQREEPRGERRVADRRASRGVSDEARLRAIIDGLADGIVIVDGKGAIRFANAAAEALFGRGLDELIGAPFGYPVLDGESAELEVRRRSGEMVTAELRVVATEWAGESVQLVSLRDITDRKRAETHARELAREQAARAEAEASSQAKSEFLAMMSHELRTPLNAVLGYAELLELGLAGPLTDMQREQLGRIRLSGRHLLNLVNEVLDLAKVEAGRLTVRRIPGRALDVVGSAVALTQPQAESQGVQLRARQDGAAPTYLGDEERVRQILLNMLSNAVKFTPSGGRITVTTGVDLEARGARLRGAGPWVYFSVEDTGIGIASEKLSVIFDPFVQAESGHTRSRDGSGLGLTISRRLARLMGGDLTVRSQLGHGSTFTLWLPAAAEERAVSAVPATDAEQGQERMASEVAGLAEVGEYLLREVEPLLDAYVARLREEPLIPGAQGMRFSQLADHIGTLVADVAETLVAVEEAAGRPSPVVSDGSEIQRLVAERHGIARARYGWSVAAVRREHAILREEIERVLRRRGHGERPRYVEHAVQLSRRFLERAEEASVAALVRASAPEPGPSA